MNYLHRAVDLQLDQLLPHVSAIAIEGPKAVGKTETAMRRSSAVLNLDSEDDRSIVDADPTFSAFDGQTILIDEWQKLPQSWDYVRRAVDNRTRKCSFLLTGSATPTAGVDTHSGAGRILSLRMRPMAIFERHDGHASISLGNLLSGESAVSGKTSWNLADYMNAIVASGFPSITELPPLVRNQQLNSYIQRIVDRDLPDQGYSVRDKSGLMAWLAAYAAASSTTTGYSEILDAATAGHGTKPAKSTTMKYREKLAEIWMLDPVPAWNFARSPLGNLAKSPKHQLADPALAVRLLSIPDNGLTHGRFKHLSGPFFESLATLSVRVAADANFATVGHLRGIKGDREVDLVVQGSDGQLIPIEVKLSANIKDDDVRHLHWFRQQFPEDTVDMVVISTSERAYRRKDGVAVVPLSLLGA
ncbi:ATP-binding protein [Corynebacterium sp. SCR221107]|uniref:ATP-binding protein n=1 Tax=Corynebacterium sp. SCR221107 TaxID=3017361 RepID=UPI002FDC1A11